jgi:dTDP-4-dehydrorhamnose reductase
MDAKARKSVVVVGSAGYLGKCLVEALSNKDYTVVSVYNRQLPESRPKVVPLCCNLLEEEPIRAALKHADTVVHAGWTMHSRGEKSLNVQMTQNLVRAMEKAGSKRLIFISSAATSRFATTRFLDEKYLCENIIINSSIKEKLIIRSGILLDSKFEGNHFLTALRGMMRLPLVYPLPDVADGISVTYRTELIELILDLVQRGSMPSECNLFEAVSATNVTMPNLMKIIKEKEQMGFKLAVRGGVGRALWSLLDKNKDEKKIAAPILELIRSGISGRSNHVSAPEFWQASNKNVAELFAGRA